MAKNRTPRKLKKSLKKKIITVKFKGVKYWVDFETWKKNKEFMESF